MDIEIKQASKVIPKYLGISKSKTRKHIVIPVHFLPIVTILVTNSFYL